LKETETLARLSKGRVGLKCQLNVQLPEFGSQKTRAAMGEKGLSVTGGQSKKCFVKKFGV